MRRSLALVAVLVVATLSLAVPASAASIAVHFTGFSITPLISDIDHPRVYQGRLVNADADGAEHGIAGAQVSLRQFGGTAHGDVVAATTTDDNGDFSGSVAYGYTRSLAVLYSPPAGSEYSGALSDLIAVYAQSVHTRISVDLAPRPMAVGDTTTVSGLVERVLADGSWIPLPDQDVRVFYVPSGGSMNLITTTHSGADGTYQVPIALPGWSGSIRVDDYTYAPGAGPYWFGENFTDRIDASFRTRITSFNAAPEPVKKGATLTVSGKLEFYGETWKPQDGVPMSIYFEPSGSTSLTSMGTVTTDGQGNFTKKFTAAKDGTWYAKFATYGNLLATNSGGDFVDVT